jgi:hypothetical protein
LTPHRDRKETLLAPTAPGTSVSAQRISVDRESTDSHFRYHPDRPMPHTIQAPELVSLRNISTQGGEVFDWHDHTFHEFTLVTDDRALIGYQAGWRETEPNTLLHYAPSERHGAWVSPMHNPRFWVVHFSMPSNERIALPALQEAAPGNRVWELTEGQTEMFQWLFLQLLDERSAGREMHRDATTAWLQLLLITLQRWTSRRQTPATHFSIRPTPEVLRLWHMINEAVTKSHEELAEIYSLPNYDSLRHAFRKTFGCSPRDMLLRLRMEHARNLLLESNLSIKEISERVGYPRQHEFYRAFRRHVGCAPSEWRQDPLLRTAIGKQSDPT